MKKLFLEIGIVVVLFDQVSKWWVERLGWEIILNQGVSWGMGREVNGWIWIMIISISLIIIYVYGMKFKKMSELFIWGSLWGGGVSNLIDRVIWGGVRDWIGVVSWFAWFNIADVAVSVAIVGIVGNYIYEYFRFSK